MEGRYSRQVEDSEELPRAQAVSNFVLNFTGVSKSPNVMNERNIDLG